MQSAAFVMSGEGTGPGRLALDEIAVAAPHEGEVLVEVRACGCLLYTSPSPRDGLLSRMPSSA